MFKENTAILNVKCSVCNVKQTDLLVCHSPQILKVVVLGE